MMKSYCLFVFIIFTLFSCNKFENAYIPFTGVWTIEKIEFTNYIDGVQTGSSVTNDNPGVFILSDFSQYTGSNPAEYHFNENLTISSMYRPKKSLQFFI